MADTCESCRFGLLAYESTDIPLASIGEVYHTEYTEIQCRRFPRFERKALGDWCGEFTAKERTDG